MKPGLLFCLTIPVAYTATSSSPGNPPLYYYSGKPAFDLFLKPGFIN
jgi:hypothetical protein